MLSPTMSSQRTMMSMITKLEVALACTNRTRLSPSGLASLKYTNLVDEDFRGHRHLEEEVEEHL